MYTRAPSYREENKADDGVRIPIPEHYSGIAFAKNEESKEQKEEACPAEDQALPLPVDNAPKSGKVNPFSFLSRKGADGREDLLLLVLALLLLDGDGGDEALALMLLALLFLG